MNEYKSCALSYKTSSFLTVYIWFSHNACLHLGSRSCSSTWEEGKKKTSCGAAAPTCCELGTTASKSLVSVKLENAVDLSIFKWGSTVVRWKTDVLCCNVGAWTLSLLVYNDIYYRKWPFDPIIYAMVGGCYNLATFFKISDQDDNTLASE